MSDTTLIAAFRSSSDAQAAANDLENGGISRDDIYIESGDNAGRSKTASHEGGVLGWFKSVFGNEHENDRSRYENAVTQGRCIVRVDADEEDIATVEDILNRHSPIDVYEEGEQTAASASGSAAKTQTGAIPVVEEELQVGKRQVLRGGVRVYSRIVEEPVKEDISLREEHVRVERRPVNRAASEADLSGQREKVIEVQEFAEQPVISKQARVVEEVIVGKDVSERTETVRDTVRHTEVNVEQTPGTAGQSSASFDDSDFRSDFQRQYAASGATYDTYQPAYRYGYDMASDARYQGRSFDQVESDLRTDYGRRYPNSAWERMKDAVRYGWNRVTGKAQSAAR